MYACAKQTLAIAGQAFGLQCQIAFGEQHTAPIVQIAGEIQPKITAAFLDDPPLNVREGIGGEIDLISGEVSLITAQDLAGIRKQRVSRHHRGTG